MIYGTNIYNRAIPPSTKEQAREWMMRRFDLSEREANKYTLKRVRAIFYKHKQEIEKCQCQRNTTNR